MERRRPVDANPGKLLARVADGGVGVACDVQDENAPIGQVDGDHAPLAVQRSLAHGVVARVRGGEPLAAGAAALSLQSLDSRVVRASLALREFVLDGAPYVRHAQHGERH